VFQKRTPLAPREVLPILFASSGLKEASVPEEGDSQWLEIIGKALAYLCVQQVAQSDPNRVPDVVAKVKFLEGIGLSTSDAAQLLGTTANSVKTNLRQRQKRKGSGNGKKSKK
jgi:hypothetical protein